MIMTSIFSILVILLPLQFIPIFSLSCRNFVAQHSRLKIENNQLYDSYGDKVQLRGYTSTGFGASTYRYACVTKESISYAATNYGVTLFRLPILISADENGYEAYPEYYENFINDVVLWCEEIGIYVIIDWHVTSPYGDPNHWLDSPGGSTGLAIDFWKKMATRYKTKKHVMYEIANEPNNVTWASVLDYSNSVIKEIRLIDPLNIIIVGTTHWSQDIDLPVIEPVTQTDNVMYSFHFYASSHGYLYDFATTYVDQLPLFSTWAVSESSGTGAVNYTVANKYLELFAGVTGALTTTSWVMSAMSDSVQTSSTLLPSSCTQKKWTSLTDTGKYINSYLLNTSYFIQHDLTWCNAAPTGEPTGQPTSAPSISFSPTGQPTGLPTQIPTSQPTIQPTHPHPTSIPTAHVNNANTNSLSSLSTGAIIGISLGGLAVLLIVFLLIAWIVKSASNKSKYRHQYQSPEGDIAMKKGGSGGGGGGGGGGREVGQTEGEDLESSSPHHDSNENEYLSTVAIYRQEDSSISRDITVVASHDSVREEEGRGRELTRGGDTSSPGKSNKRTSHSPPPTNPLHQKKRQSRSKSPVPQGSKKKRNSSRSPSPGR